MNQFQIDINCDLGEVNYTKAPHLIQILDHVSSCNIATGFHAGDPVTILKTIQYALHKKVAIGVHPSYPDRDGFGRISVDLSSEELYANLIYQISALSGICKTQNTRLDHLKLHGALYHDAHQKKEVAQVIAEVVRKWPYPLTVYGLSNSYLEIEAKKEGIPWVEEGFIDRRYQPDGKLLPRTHTKAVIDDPQESINQGLKMILEKKVGTINQTALDIDVKTLCIHADHPSSLLLAINLYQQLRAHNIQIKKPDLL